MSFESWENTNRRNYAEMEKTYHVEVINLGKILEGEGHISSTLQEQDYDRVSEALRQSVALIEEPDCAACGDGRCVRHLANGGPGKIRPRKFGASMAPVVMMGLGDKLHLASLEDGESVYDAATEVQGVLGNKECGHVDCGADTGLIKHIRLIGELKLDSISVNVVRKLMEQESPDTDFDAIASDIIAQAPAYADVLEAQGWHGPEYVNSLANKDGETVEILETDDSPLHGHAEQAVVLIDGPVDGDGRPLHTIDKDKFMELTGLQIFAVNLNELRRDADKLGGTAKQKAQLLTAGLLHHIGGVYKDLGDGSHPVFAVKIQ